MLIRSKPIDVPSKDPFKNDQLERKPHVENLCTLLSNLESPHVLSIDAPWGHGKTTFSQMLSARLALRGSKTVLFSAWETDFAQDPLQVFLGELNEQIIGSIEEKDTTVVAKFNKLKLTAGHVVKKLAPLAMKLATQGMLDISSNVETTLGSMGESIVNDVIEQYVNDKTAIEDFKKALEELLAETGDRLYVFVDELDRCRPNYAIELLERIKHILDVEGLIFVLSMDKQQLSHSIRAVYGNEFDSNRYLKRFIDIEYTLPVPQKDKYIDFMYNQLRFVEQLEPRAAYRSFIYDEETIKKTLKIIVAVKAYAIRDIQQLMARVKLALMVTPANQYLHPALLIFLISTKDTHPAIYENFIDDKSEPDEIIEHFHSLMQANFRFENHKCALIEGSLIAAKINPLNERKPSQYMKYKTLLTSNESDRCDKESTPRLESEQIRYIEAVIGISDRPTDNYGGLNLKNVLEAIEMTKQFNTNLD